MGWIQVNDIEQAIDEAIECEAPGCRRPGEPRFDHGYLFWECRQCVADLREIELQIEIDLDATIEGLTRIERILFGFICTVGSAAFILAAVAIGQSMR